MLVKKTYPYDSNDKQIIEINIIPGRIFMQNPDFVKTLRNKDKYKFEYKKSENTENGSQDNFDRDFHIKPPFNNYKPEFRKYDAIKT
jgi:hypothetical protein